MTEKTITEKQYEKLMFAISMLLTKQIEKDLVLPSGRIKEVDDVLGELQTGDAKEIYDFLLGNSFDDDLEALEKKRKKAYWERVEEQRRKEEKENEDVAKEFAENNAACQKLLEKKQKKGIVYA